MPERMTEEERAESRQRAEAALFGEEPLPEKPKDASAKEPVEDEPADVVDADEKEEPVEAETVITHGMMKIGQEAGLTADEIAGFKDEAELQRALAFAASRVKEEPKPEPVADKPQDEKEEKEEAKANLADQLRGEEHEPEIVAVGEAVDGNAARIAALEKTIKGLEEQKTFADESQAREEENRLVGMLDGLEREDLFGNIDGATKTQMGRVKTILDLLDILVEKNLAQHNEAGVKQAYNAIYSEELLNAADEKAAKAKKRASSARKKNGQVMGSGSRTEARDDLPWDGEEENNPVYGELIARKKRERAEASSR